MQSGRRYDATIVSGVVLSAAATRPAHRPGKLYWRHAARNRSSCGGGRLEQMGRDSNRENNPAK